MIGFVKIDLSMKRFFGEALFRAVFREGFVIGNTQVF